MPRADIVVYNIGELITFHGGPRARPRPENAGILHHAGVAVRDGVVVEVGGSEWVRDRYTASVYINAGGRLATPGLVDTHTHPLFAGSREDELELKASGVGYGEIARRGGGIKRTMRDTMNASDGELLGLLESRLDKMLHYGTTTVEAKTGYGATVGEDLRHIRILASLPPRPQQVVKTVLAHVPPGDDRKGYIEEFKSRALPEAARHGFNYADVFCDNVAFTPSESHDILAEARRHGLRLRAHAEQLSRQGCTQAIAPLGPDALDHLDRATGTEVEILAKHEITAGLLPTSTLAMFDDARPPVGEFRRHGVYMALGSDYNPNNRTPNMQTVIALAVYLYRLTPLEALAAATVNAAKSLGLEGTTGRIAPGRRADIIIWEHPGYKWIPYKWTGDHVDAVIASGIIAKNRLGHE